MKHRIIELGGEVVGEEYRILGEDDFSDIAKKIVNANPDIILNTINGDSNIHFFTALQKQGIGPDSIPTISFSIGENEISHIENDIMKNNYAAWNYFQSIDSNENIEFVKNFQNKFGRDRVTNDPMVAAYEGVYLFAKSVAKSESSDVDDIRNAVKGLTFDGPEGLVGVDPVTNHLVKTVRIGKINNNNQFDIVFSSVKPIFPIPYPDYKNPEEWEAFLDSMYADWGNNWSNNS